MRCFASLDFDNLFLENAVELQEKIKKILSHDRVQYKLIPKEQMHLTLAFFADIDDAEVNEKLAKFKTLLSGAKTFEFKVGKVIFLPSPVECRIVALELYSPELFALQKKLAKALEYDEKRDFKAHLTLFRLNKGKINSTAQIEKLFDKSPLTWKAKALSFKKSTLTHQGPVYGNLESVVLT